MEQCKHCKGTGIIVIERKRNNTIYDYGYACMCNLGDKFRNQFKSTCYEEINYLRHSRNKYTELTAAEETEIYDADKRNTDYSKYKGV